MKIKAWPFVLAFPFLLSAAVNLNSDTATNAQEPAGAVEITTYPSSDSMAAGIARTPLEGRWIVMSADLMPVQADSYKLSSGGSIVMWEGAPGSVYVTFFFPTDQAAGIGVKRIVLGKAPKPPPKPGPVDPDPTTEATGLLSVVILSIPEERTAENATKMLEINDWIDQQDGSKLRRFTLDPEQTPTYNSLADGDYPFVLVLQEIDDSPGAKSVVRWKGDLPDLGTIQREVDKWLE